jgi:hypothetical protein
MALLISGVGWQLVEAQFGKFCQSSLQLEL